MIRTTTVGLGVLLVLACGAFGCGNSAATQGQPAGGSSGASSGNPGSSGSGPGSSGSSLGSSGAEGSSGVGTSVGSSGASSSGGLSSGGTSGASTSSGSSSGTGPSSGTGSSSSASSTGSGTGDGAAPGVDSGGAPQPSANCPAPTLNMGDNNFTLASANGTMYTYTITIPAGYDPTKLTPTTIFWHALDSAPSQTRMLTDIDAVAAKAGNVMVYPSSSDLSWNAGGCCTQETGAPMRDESVFAKELVAAVESKVCVDTKRIYIMGFSNGGMLTDMLSCKMAGVFAAAAPSAGALTIPTSECTPTQPMPIYMINGTADPLVTYSSGSIAISSISVPDTFSFWATADKCTGNPVNTLTKGAVSCSTYKQCAGGAQVTLCTVTGMGHCEPGMMAQSSTNCLTVNGVNLGPPNNDIDGTQTSMDFLQMFSLP